jgi:ribonuclease D
LAIVRALAEFRESYAQTRDIPRSRVFKDDALIELASTKPKTFDDLQKSRLLLREARKGEIANGILKAVKYAIELPQENLPKVPDEKDMRAVNQALADLLRVLLKAKTENNGVAAKLIASSAELDALASGERDVPTLRGWRYEVFGQDALRLCNGEIGLVAKGKSVKTFDIP